MRSTESPSSSESLIQAYLDFLQLERRYSAHSIAATKRDLSCLTGNLLLIQASDLKIILAKRHTQGAAASSLARLASSWRGFFGFLSRSGFIQTNPALALKTPKLAKRLPKAVGIDQIGALLSHPMPGDFRFAQAHALIELLYGTGLRISEALSLQIQDSSARQGDSWVSFERNEIQVLGKGGKTRLIPLNEQLKSTLKEFLAKRDQFKNKLLNQANLPTPKNLFLSAKGKNYTARMAQSDVREYAKLQGLDQRLHPHMLRHSFGSHLLQSSQNLRAVQELLGHASIVSTQVYTALDFNHLASVYDNAFPRAKTEGKQG